MNKDEARSFLKSGKRDIQIELDGLANGMPRIELYNRMLECLGEKEYSEKNREPDTTFGNFLTEALNAGNLQKTAKTDCSSSLRKKWADKGYDKNFTLYYTPTERGEVGEKGGEGEEIEKKLTEEEEKEPEAEEEGEEGGEGEVEEKDEEEVEGVGVRRGEKKPLFKIPKKNFEDSLKIVEDNANDDDIRESELRNMLQNFSTFENRKKLFDSLKNIVKSDKIPSRFKNHYFSLYEKFIREHLEEYLGEKEDLHCLWDDISNTLEELYSSNLLEKEDLNLESTVVELVDTIFRTANESYEIKKEWLDTIFSAFENVPTSENQYGEDIGEAFRSNLWKGILFQCLYGRLYNLTDKQKDFLKKKVQKLPLETSSKITKDHCLHILVPKQYIKKVWKSYQFPGSSNWGKMEIDWEDLLNEK